MSGKAPQFVYDICFLLCLKSAWDSKTSNFVIDGFKLDDEPDLYDLKPNLVYLGLNWNLMAIHFVVLVSPNIH